MVDPVVVTHRAGTTPVHVYHGALAALPAYLTHTWPSAHLVVLADATVAAACPSPLPGVEVLTFPGGEAHKTRAEWARLTDLLLARAVGRDVVLVAFGGGVTTDLVGFVAATLYRGVPWVAVPTSTLAMIDASVGGKTGVDTAVGKNLVGAFHPPVAVFADPATLATLPETSFREGLAEAVKHAAIRDATYATWLRTHAAALRHRDPTLLAEAIRWSVQIKAAVVSADEQETGERAILNAGHTVAHAIELVSDYRIPHGEAVAMGLALETQLAEQLGVAEAGTAAQVRQMLAAFDLPTVCPADLPLDDLLSAMRQDKKNRAGTLRMALLARVGTTARDGSQWTHAVDPSAVRAVLRP